jgi:hypothetical protein
LRQTGIKKYFLAHSFAAKLKAVKYKSRITAAFVFYLIR